MKRRVVLVRYLAGYFVERVPPVAELPDPCADIGERKVVAACGVEQHGRLTGTREGNAARPPRPRLRQKLKRVR